MINLMFALLLQFAVANTSDRDFLKQECLKDLKKYKNNADICQCYDRNLARRITPEFLAILVKEKRGQSVEKELDTVEGATVIFTFEESILLKCVKNQNYEIAPEQR